LENNEKYFLVKEVDALEIQEISKRNVLKMIDNSLKVVLRMWLWNEHK